MNNYLEQIKVESALNSEIRKLDHRKKHKPKDVNILDYTVIEALKKQIPKYPVETQELCDIEWLCPTCNSKVGVYMYVDNYCRKCGQRIMF